MSLSRPTLPSSTVQFHHIIVDPAILKLDAYQQYKVEIEETFKKIKVGGKGLKYKVIKGINAHPRLNEVRVDGKVRLFYVTYTTPNGENCCVIMKLMSDHNHPVVIKKYKSFLKAMKLAGNLEGLVHSARMQKVVDKYFEDLEKEKLKEGPQVEQEQKECIIKKPVKDHTLSYFPAELYDDKWIVLSPEQRDFLHYVKAQKPSRAIFIGPQGCGKTLLATFIMAQDGSDAQIEDDDEREEQTEPDVIYHCLKEGLLEQKKCEWEKFPLAKKVQCGKVAHRTYLQQLKIDYPDRVFVGADHCKNWLRSYIDSQKGLKKLPAKLDADKINIERIIEMIYADFRILSCPENLKEDSGQKSRLNFQGEMEWTLGALENYREFLKGREPSEELWNADFTRLLKRPGVRYLGDEAQDWSDDQIYGICQQDTAYLFMDPNQRTGFGHASLESIKTTCNLLKVSQPVIKELNISYRNPLSVIAATVFFMQLRSFLDVGTTTGGQKNHILGIFNEAKSNAIKWLETGPKSLDQLKQLVISHRIAIVTWDKEKAKKIFGNIPLIFTPDQDIKGMEFEYVVGFELCNNPFYAVAIKKINKFLKDNNVTLKDIYAAGESTHRTKLHDLEDYPLIGALITALGRTLQLFAFYETPKTIAKYRKLFGLIQEVTGYDVVSPEQCFQNAETMRLEDWEKTAETFILQGNDQHAQDIFEVLKKKGKFAGEFAAYKNAVIEAAKPKCIEKVAVNESTTTTTPSAANAQSNAKKQDASFVNKNFSSQTKTESLIPGNQNLDNNKKGKPKTNQKVDIDNKEKPNTVQNIDKDKEFIAKLSEENAFKKVFYKGKNKKNYYDNLNAADKKIFLETCLTKDLENNQFYLFRLINDAIFALNKNEQMKTSFLNFISDLMKYPSIMEELLYCAAVEEDQSVLLNALLLNKDFKNRFEKLHYLRALFFATQEGHAKIVEVLLNHGVDPDQTLDGDEEIKDEETVLSVAMRENHPEVVNILLTHPTKSVNPKFLIWDDENEDLILPLCYAIKLKQPKLIKLILDLKTINDEILNIWYGQAVKTNNIESMILLSDKFLLGNRCINLETEKYEDVEKQIKEQYLPALIYAVEADYIDAVNIFLNHVTDLNIVIEGDTALSIAMRKNNFKMIDNLFNYSLNPINPDLIILDDNKQPISQFNYAIKLKQPKVIKLFLDYNKTINEKTLNDGLVLAAETGYIASICYIRDRLINDNKLTIKIAYDALVKAVENKYMLAAKILIDCIVSMAEKANLLDGAFKVILETAVAYDQVELINFFLKNKIDRTLLKQEDLFKQAIVDGKFEVIKLLVEVEQNPNLIRKFFDIAKTQEDVEILGLFNKKIPELISEVYKFYKAVENNDVETVKYFMSPRDNWYPTTSLIKTQYLNAAQNDRIEVMEILTSNYALDPSQITASEAEITVFHQAVLGNNLKTMQFLLKDERVKNCINKVQVAMTPLCAAVMRKRPEAVRILLEHNADPNLMCNYSPLGLAIFTNNVEMVKILLKVDSLNLTLGQAEEKMTSLHLAVFSGNPEIVKLLLTNNKADLTLLVALDYENNTALDLAIKINNSNPEIINLINEATLRFDRANEANNNLPLSRASRAGITYFRPPLNAINTNTTNNPSNQNSTDPHSKKKDKKRIQRGKK